MNNMAAALSEIVGLCGARVSNIFPTLDDTFTPRQQPNEEGRHLTAFGPNYLRALSVLSTLVALVS